MSRFHDRALHLARTHTTRAGDEADYVGRLTTALNEAYADGRGEALNMRTLSALADMSDAAVHAYRLRWAVGDSVIADGVVRAFTRENGASIHADDDVRDAYLWVSGTSEYFVPVRALIDLMGEDLAVVIR